MMSNVAVVLSVALFSNTFPHLPCYSDDADDGTTSRLHGVGKMHQPRLDKNDTIKSRPQEGRVPQQEYAVVTLPDKINPATPKSSNSYAACIERGCMQDRRRRVETDLLKPIERWLSIDLSFIPSTSKQSKATTGTRCFSPSLVIYTSTSFVASSPDFIFLFFLISWVTCDQNEECACRCAW